MEGLRAAVKDAVIATVGAPSPRQPKPDPGEMNLGPAITDIWLDWTGAIQTLAYAPHDLADTWRRTPPGLRDALRLEARRAATRLAEWIETQTTEDIHVAA
jgi:hypothetical protein